MRTYRSISLTGKSSTLVCFHTRYTATIGGTDNKTDVIGVPFDHPNILQYLHDLATDREWSREVERAGDKGCTPSQLEVQRWLIAQGPRVILQPLSADARQGDLAFLLQRLKEKAHVILRRKTIFLLPEKPDSVLTDDEERLAEKIAGQLNNLLKYGHELDFSFVRVGTRGKELGMLDLIIEYLHGEISTPVFENKAPEREGPILLCGPTGTGKSYATKSLARRLGKKTLFM